MISNLTPAEVTALLASMSVNQTVVFSMQGDERIVFNVTLLSNGYIWKIGDTAIFQSTGGSPSGSDFKTAFYQISNSELYSASSSPVLLPIAGVTPTDKIEVITASIYFLGDPQYLCQEFYLEVIGSTSQQQFLFINDPTTNNYLRFSTSSPILGFQYVAGAGLQLRVNVDSIPAGSPHTVSILYISYRIIP